MATLLDQFNDLKISDELAAKWEAPSNIAFVKYWGKIGHQIPANPSLSLTLKNSYSQTTALCYPSDRCEVIFKFEGKENQAFAVKIQAFLQILSKDWKFLQKLKFEVSSSNTFPHSTGIASSASGMAAFSLCLLDIIYQAAKLPVDQLFYIRASFLARLASGSACRSIYGGLVQWGQTSQSGSFSDTHATPLVHAIHPEFKNLHDAILIVSSEEKTVSSREGHGRMEDHVFAQTRFTQAKNHFQEILVGLKTGDWDKVGTIIESEALSLHAMMLTSPNPYILLKPRTLELIALVKNFREQTKLPVYFTLDAGPNLHVIYPDSVKDKIKTFLENEARPFVESIIFDEEGDGPRLC